MATKSYAVWWTEREGPRRVGKLELGQSRAFLAGRGGGRIPLDDVESIEYGNGEITLRFDVDRLLRLRSLDAPGALREAGLRLVAREAHRTPHLADRPAGVSGEPPPEGIGSST